MKRKSAIVSLLVVAGLAVVEASAFVLTEFWMRPRGAFYDPTSLAPLISEASWEDYLASRDPVVGWPAPRSFGDADAPEARDAFGSRPSPAFPEPGPACVSVYGASFAYAGEVDHAQAWTDHLARKLGCRVANYGVSAYGTDQSLLRFKGNSADEAPIAVLAFMGSNIERNLNRWALYKYTPVRYRAWRQFKPRFVLGEGGQLELLELPEPSWQELGGGLADPAGWLEHDWFAPGKPAGVPVHTPSFPYLRSVYRVARSALFPDPRRNENHLAFFAEHHPSGAYALTRAILVEFARTARERGVDPLILFIPSSHEFERYRETGEWVSGALARAVAAEGIPVVNVLEEMSERIGAEHVCENYTIGGCRYHFDSTGNELLAEVALEPIQTLQRSLAARARPSTDAGAAAGLARQVPTRSGGWQ